MPLPGTAERALLAQLLLSAGRTIPASMLIDRLWAESSLPVDPTNALQIRVSKLRRSLKANHTPDLVTREGVGYRANVDPEAVDAIDFANRVRVARAATAAASAHDAGVDVLESNLAAYDGALELWRGEPLSDFNTEQWAISEAARLSALRITALTERAQTALALGRHHEVVHDLEPVVGGDPTLESLAGLLMVALYRAGRQADALEVYARTRRTLDEELGSRTIGHPAVAAGAGAAPGRGARRAGRGGRARARPHNRRSGAPRRPPRSVPTNLPTVVRPLIGRDELLESLRTLLPGVRLLSLVGPGGSGKTSLALTLAVHAMADFPDGVFGGTTGLAGHATTSPCRRGGRARHADGRCRRRT